MEVTGNGMGEVEIRCISHDTIRSATQTQSTQRLELTPWDLSLLALNPIQKGLFFHKPIGNTWISDLKTSLSLVLHHFFPLAGRLATESHDDGTISVFIQCNNAGAEFIHAKVDVSLSDVLDPLYIPRIVHDFFPLNYTINYDGTSKPLLSVQVNELLDGVFIGFTMNHTVADGASFWGFLNSWSEICRSTTNSNQISYVPNFNRWFLKQSDLPVRIPASRIEQSIKPYDLPLLQERVFYLSPQNISKLKAKANLENKKKKVVISSLQAVVAHVWRGVVRARKLESTEETSYRILMGNRGRINPPLPERYFGNSIGLGVATAKVGELMEEGGLGFAAGLLNQVVSLHSNETICSGWENWLRERRNFGFSDYIGKTLVTGSSPRFNMYGNDFGWGRPLGVRSGRSNKFDGKLTFHATAVEGGIEIDACLYPKTMVALGQDSEFLEYVST